MPFYAALYIVGLEREDLMAGQLGTKLGTRLYMLGMIEQNQIDVIRYAFEIICSEITENIIIFGYGILSNQIIDTLMYQN